MTKDGGLYTSVTYGTSDPLSWDPLFLEPQVTEVFVKKWRRRKKNRKGMRVRRAVYFEHAKKSANSDRTLCGVRSQFAKSKKQLMGRLAVVCHKCAVEKAKLRLLEGR